MAAVSLTDLAEIERRLALRMIEVFGLDASAVALDMTNFATYIDSTNTRSDIAQRGKAKQNARTCGWLGWDWWSPVTVGCRCCHTPTRVTSPT